MSLEKRAILLLSLLSFVIPLHGQADKLVLADGWRIQPSRDVSEKGSVLSTAGYQPQQWYRATMPSTVVAALAADRVYADPYFGMNMRSIPGTTYTIGTTFSSIPMPPGSPFRSSWWYRTQFTVPGRLSRQERSSSTLMALISAPTCGSMDGWSPIRNRWPAPGGSSNST